MARASNQGYAENADALFRQYESIAFADVHRQVLHLFPAAPCRILDIGSGTGRDAAGFAALGHDVVAVEPTAEFRRRAALLHPSPQIEWVDDRLPELAVVGGRGERFAVVMLTAVWMHLDRRQRRRAMPVVAGLVASGGVLVLSLRHGPVPPGRRMFAVSADETIALAAAANLRLMVRFDGQNALLGSSGVSWTRLAFTKPAPLA